MRELREHGRRVEDRVVDAADKLGKAVPKLPCPACGEFASSVVRCRADDTGQCYRRARKCLWCGFIFGTEERVSAIVPRS